MKSIPRLWVQMVHKLLSGLVVTVCGGTNFDSVGSKEATLYLSFSDATRMLEWTDVHTFRY